jgi:diguanylate cyclase
VLMARSLEKACSEAPQLHCPHIRSNPYKPERILLIGRFTLIGWIAPKKKVQTPACRCLTDPTVNLFYHSRTNRLLAASRMEAILRRNCIVELQVQHGHAMAGLLGVRSKMILPLGVSLSYVLLDASLAVIAFCVGFLGAYWYFRTHPAPEASTPNPQLEQSDPKKIYEAERTNMAVQQLRDLAANMAQDVGAHNQLVSGISDKLGTISHDNPDHDFLFQDSLQQILTANEKLKTRLDDAERKIEAQSEELKAQQSEARTDSLTKLANRRAFDDSLAVGVSQFQTQGRPLSLLMFDVDHFKKFNDTYGHQAGDEVLRQVAKSLSKSAKSTDLACRYGGEEFALIMPGTVLDQAKVAAERVRKAIESTTVNFEGQSLNVTASIGVAELNANEPAVGLIRRSDEAIYEAKEAGRNRSYWNNGRECLPVNLENQAPAKSKLALSQPVTYQELIDLDGFTHEVQRRVSECHRTGTPLSLICLRITGFQAIESEFGVAASEMLLDYVAQFITGTLRDMDLLARMETGVFAMMLPSATEKDATVVANRIKSALAHCSIPVGIDKLSLVTSHGVAQVKPADEAESLIVRAQEQIGMKLSCASV